MKSLKTKKTARIVLLIAFAALVGSISASIMIYAGSGTEPGGREISGTSTSRTPEVQPKQAPSGRIEVEEKQVQTVSDANPDVTESDIDLLARLLTSEQGYAMSHEGQARENIIDNYYHTGAVVLNRIKSSEFPNNMHDVIYQRGQYDVVRTGAINNEYDDIAWEVAEELLTYGHDIPEDVVFQAEFRQGSAVYKQIGRTYYCRR